MTHSPFHFLLDETSLERLAEDMARVIGRGDCLCLEGDLGAGKSTFARAFIRALAVEDTLEVPSPTFTLVQTYALDIPVTHFDLYRIADSQEVEELGLDEALETGVALIEWPAQGEGYVPANHVKIAMAMPDGNPSKRAITISGPDDFMERFARSLRIRTLLEEAGWGDAKRQPLSGDASARDYELVTFEGEQRIVMDAPATPDGPPIRDGMPYSKIAHLAEDVSAFVAIAKALKSKGLCAPEIYGFDLEAGLVLLEHLGQGSILNADRKPIKARYVEAAKCLAMMHHLDWPDTMLVDDKIAHRVPTYDWGVFAIEADLLLDWYVPWRSGSPVSDAERAAYHEAFKALHASLDFTQTTLIHRDYHSPNILWREGDSPAERIGLIDFQDALIGPCAYDVMSLAEDARVDLSDDTRQAVIAAYCEAMDGPDFDEVKFLKEAAIVAAQRSCKILGIFVRLNQRDGKPDYMAHLPRVESALKRALAHSALADLRSVLSSMKVI